MSQQPAILATTLTSANTEYEIVVPRGTQQFAVFTNDSADLRISPKAGEVATPADEYLSIPEGRQYFLTDIELSRDTTLYVASDSDSTTALLHYWS